MMFAQKCLDESVPHVNNFLQKDSSNSADHCQQLDEDGNSVVESDVSESSCNEDEKDEYIVVRLSDIRKEVQCPICLGIIRKTRTVMECLHRFCRECIDKSMRLGNNECPACRTHCASRRSLRDDPNYDALIAALYPDIDKYEEEELAFGEEEKARNRQIQASIDHTSQRQAEALSRKRSAAAKSVTSALPRRAHSRYLDLQARGRRSYRNADFQVSDDNEDEAKESSSGDELGVESRPKRPKRWASGAQSATSNGDANCDENDYGSTREHFWAPVGLTGSSERLAWGRGGMRSHTRHGSASVSNGRNTRSNRISRLADHLKNTAKNENNLDVHVFLVSLDDKTVPTLKYPYLSCRPTLSISHLCRYVALQTALRAAEVEIHLVKEPFSFLKPSMFKQGKHEMQSLDGAKTLACIETSDMNHGHLVLAYAKKDIGAKAEVADQLAHK